MLDREITVIYDEGVQGFTSFQTYAPDFALSLNNRFFSWNRGIIWEHHIPSADRNEFYDINNDSIIRIVFNDSPSTIKTFKTVGYEGDGNWDVDIMTDQESTITDNTTIPVTRSVSGSVTINGQVNTTGDITGNSVRRSYVRSAGEIVQLLDTNGDMVPSDFVDRQGKKFGYIRGRTKSSADLDLKTLAVQGLGLCVPLFDSVDTIIFNNELPSELAIGDELYFFQASGDTFLTTLQPSGPITAIDRTTNTITFTRRGGNLSMTTGDFILFSKDAEVETSGVIGFYGIMEFRSSDVAMVELFSINTEIFASNN